MINELGNIATIISACAALVALLVGFLEILYVNNRQRQQTARALYSEFVKMAISHPLFGDPQRFLERYDFDNQVIDNSKEKFEQYEWFLSLLIGSAREILESMPKDVYWEKVILRNFRYHREYLAWRERQNRPNDFIHNRGPQVSALIRKVTHEKT